MRIDAISIGHNPPEDINVIVEVPVGGEPIKYEMDKASGAMFVDRFLYTSMRYPGNYGFVPHTLSEDGDPLDVLIANTRTLVPGCVMNCRPIGVLFMKDEAGMDEKLIAVPSQRVSGNYDGVHSLDDLQELKREQIVHFFERYKDLEKGKWVELDRWGDADEAKKMVLASIEAAK
ncbi:MAG: inorganic diphosphatase [Pseudomonadota bacterium]